MSTGSSDETIMVLGAPAIPGLTFRGFRGEADLTSMVAVREGCRDADHIDPCSIAQHIPTEAELARWLALAVVGEHAIDPARDILLAQVDGQVIGYNRVTWWAEQDGTWVYLHLGYLLPAWRRRGLARALLVRALRTLREREARPIRLTVCASNETGAQQLYESVGFRAIEEHVRYRKPLAWGIQWTALGLPANVGRKSPNAI